MNEKQIAELKAKYPGKELYLVTVEGKGCILRSPGRQDLSYASVARDPVKRKEVLLNQLWVAGDEEIKTDDRLFFSVMPTLDRLFEIKEAELKKL